MKNLDKHLENDNTAMIYFFVAIVLMAIADAILN